MEAANSSSNNLQLVNALENFLNQMVAEDKFSGAVLVARDKPIFKKAYGLASICYNVPNQVDTKFNLGSLNKMFTAVVIAQLAESGKLSFNDPIGQYLPDYPNKKVAQTVTIHHLLTHTAGMGNFFNYKFFNTSRDKLREIRDYLPLVVNEPLEFEPGSRFSYSNAGFLLLGLIIEQVSGQNYFDYIREHIYQRASMVNSDCYDLDQDVPNLAIGYTRGSDGIVRNNIFTHVIKGGPAGGGYSTVEDLFRFAVALMNHHLLNPESTKTVLTGKVDTPDPSAKYGYGFGDIRVNGLRLVGHSGGFFGISSVLDIYPESGYVVAILSNYDQPAAGKVSDYVGELLQA